MEEAFSKNQGWDKIESLIQTNSVVKLELADDLGHDKFDIVLSKDSFEHYNDPENQIFTMQQYLKEEGILVIGFGPLWKSPYGGHISWMTKFPWAHLIFPESVIMAERKTYSNRCPRI